jgi:hypothetical protein
MVEETWRLRKVLKGLEDKRESAVMAESMGSDGETVEALHPKVLVNSPSPPSRPFLNILRARL